MRGVVNDLMNPQFVVRLSLAIGAYFGKGASIIVGRDARAGSSFITHIVIGSLLSEGLKVYDAGLTPTPALQYYVKEGGFDGGVMVTASHNPPEYDGIKVIMGDGIEAPRSVEEEIEKIFHEERFTHVPWNLLGEDARKVGDVNDRYIRGIIDKVDTDLIRGKGFRVAVDSANNVGSLTTPKLLRMLGVKVVAVNSEISPIPARKPEPTPENLKDFSKAVRTLHMDLGVAHDGDADRAIFLDSEGDVIPGDLSALVLCRHIAKYRKDNTPRRVVTAVSSSTIVEDVLREYGIVIVWTKVGSVVIARKMVELGAMAGFEENGGFMYPPHQYVRDGAMSTALMLEHLAMEGRGLREIISEFPKRHIIKTKIPLPSREKLPKIYEMLEGSFPDARAIKVDGIKLIGKGFWVLVRPSGTEPILRIFVEAGDREEAEKLLNEVNAILQSVIR